MELAALLPLIIIGAVISLAVRTAEQKKRQAAQRRADVERQQAQQNMPPVQPKQPYVPVRPTVQAPAPARQAAPAPKPKPADMKPRVGSGAFVPMEGPPIKNGQKLHQDHDFCSLPTEDPKARKGQHPDHDLCALRPDDPKTRQAAIAPQGGGTILNLTPDNIVSGVLFSEILGKPKALR